MKIRRKPQARRGLRAALAAVLTLILIAAAGLPVYVWPQVDPVRRADAVLVVGGPDYDRYGLGLDLGRDGWAPTVVLSNPNGARDPWLDRFCTDRPTDFELICFVPDPATTRGEGRELRRLAQQRGWNSVIVVTFRPHISRARTILSRCFDGELIMVASAAELSPPSWAKEYVLQTAGYVRAAVSPGC